MAGIKQMIPPETVARILELYQQHLTLSEIGFQLGLSRDTVRKYLRKAGIYRDPRKRLSPSPTSSPPHSPPSPTRQLTAPFTVDFSDLKTMIEVLESQLAQKTSPAASNEPQSASPEPTLTPEDEIIVDREQYGLREQVKTTDRKYKALLKQLDEAEERLRVALEIREHYSPIKVTAAPGNAKGEATAIWLASDWHVGLRVDKSTVNGLNEYNPDIAAKRAKKFFANGLKLVRKERQDVHIDTLILWLGGDFQSNWIHPELAESNFLSPVEEILLAQDLLAGGINYLQEEGEFKRIIIPCNFGNHGRITQKKRVSNGQKTSFEWMLYHHLSQRFKENSKIEFLISDGYFNYVSVYGHNLRFSHGDNVKYGGGIGGVTIPLLRYIAKSNQQQFAHHDLIGHFHNLIQHPQFTINGSLCGYDAYALSIGASPERPQQAMRLLDSKRGWTISCPIFVQD